ncbi:MAG: Si-specific NAD(P)(+) transhydrogenase [Myxococcales bacterium]|nr:Si-specific NAD(P)(+) transhydrogenase [Myxococcales bacterium]
MSYDYDLVVIGGGPAGEKGAAQAAYFGKRVALIEQAPEPGGACVHTGTLPSKTLREAALVLSGYRNRHLYGIRLEIDRGAATPRMLSRKDAVRRLEVERIKWNLDRHGVTCFRGHARMIDAHTVAVEPLAAPMQKLTAEFVLIATGSEPFRPADIPFDDSDVDDSDTVLGIDRLPKRLVVLGAGVIGCEYACMFAALGVEVVLVDARQDILPFLDREMSERLRQGMIALGIECRLGVKYSKIARESAEVIRTTLDDGTHLDSDKVLYCAGRNGRTGGLGLDTVGITPDKRGALAVDANYRTPVPSIYAVGDVIGFPALASTSMEQARVAVVHAFGLGYKTKVGALLPYGIYTVPEVSYVGMTEEEARKANVDYVVGRAFFRDNARGKIIGDRDGVVKLMVERGSRKLVGVHVIGERAAELVHIGQAIMTLGGGVDALIEMVFNYPTLSECYKYAAYDALGALAQGNKASSDDGSP